MILVVLDNYLSMHPGNNEQIQQDGVLIQRSHADPRLQSVDRLLAFMHSDIWLNQHGGVFILNVSQMHTADHVLLEGATRVVLDAISVAVTME
jgi:hypothetical protein